MKFTTYFHQSASNKHEVIASRLVIACDLASSLLVPDHLPHTGVLETAASLMLHFAIIVRSECSLSHDLRMRTIYYEYSASSIVKFWLRPCTAIAPALLNVSCSVKGGLPARSFFAKGAADIAQTSFTAARAYLAVGGIY